jgi:hypothetical protein
MHTMIILYAVGSCTRRCSGWQHRVDVSTRCAPRDGMLHKVLQYVYAAQALQNIQFLDGLVVMIRLSHSRERGSIPRRGSHFFGVLSF